MPLDADARRYADNLLAERREQCQQDSQKKVLAIYQDFSSRKRTQSGEYATAMANESVELLVLLCEARIETLLTASDKAGIPFDSNTHEEIMNEVSQFCAQTEKEFANRIKGIASNTGHQSDGFDDAVLSDFARSVSGAMTRVYRRLQIKRDEIVLAEKRTQKVYAAGLGKKWDVFICHASEDKDAFVRPLAQALITSGLSVWFDEITFKVGDSLRRTIDHGLSASRYGIVVLSLHLFAKQWPQAELDGMYSREVEGVKVVLPVWLNITADQVRTFSPLLAGKFAATGSVETVVVQLREAMGL